MRIHHEKALTELLAKTKEAFLGEFEIPYDGNLLAEHLARATRERVAKFCHKRLEHLKDADFFAFYKIFLDDLNGVKTQTQNTQRKK